ncbi:hypothetical protein EDC04DRAFT_2772360 [Pisolithus marmoratus]|nr:hypothetical protein EDC04DRAFT_2772360 [Pisolithus marmoratus]
MNFKLLSLLALGSLPIAMAGPLAYAVCQTGCNMVAVTCYSVAGFTFGAVAAPAAPPLILACNAAQGACMATCAATALLAPIP